MLLLPTFRTLRPAIVPSSLGWLPSRLLLPHRQLRRLAPRLPRRPPRLPRRLLSLLPLSRLLRPLLLRLRLCRRSRRKISGAPGNRLWRRLPRRLARLPRRLARLLRRPPWVLRLPRLLRRLPRGREFSGGVSGLPPSGLPGIPGPAGWTTAPPGGNSPTGSRRGVSGAHAVERH